MNLTDSIMIMEIKNKVKNIYSDIVFQRLMECINDEVIISCNGQVYHFDNGKQVIMTLVGKHEIKSVSIREKQLYVELVNYKVEPLTVFYITNCPEVALIAERYGVDRIWIDLEILGKEKRQKNMDTVKSHHNITDIAIIKSLLTKADMLVRVNSWHEGSRNEIEAVIAAGADIIMLPYWKTIEEVRKFIKTVNGRCKTTLLLETKEAVDCIDKVLEMGGFDEIHIGLNDLHLSYGMTFMFELLADGTVEMLCNKFKANGIPYGFGGIAKLGDGLLPAEKIIMEHYRLGSSRAILSRTFCDNAKIKDIKVIDRVFRKNMEELRKYEKSMANVTQKEFIRNKIEVIKAVEEIVATIKYAKGYEN